MRKFSLAYLTIPGTDPISQIKIAADAGYNSVSLRTIPLGLPGEPNFDIHNNESLFNEIKQAMREFNMPVHDIELARVLPDFDVTQYEPAFEKAAMLGVKEILGSIWTRDKAYYTEQVATICEIAKRYGMNYHVEFLPWAGVRNLQEAITLVDSLDLDNLYIMIDTLHAARAGVTPEEIVRTDKKYFGFMHICDGPAGPNNDPVLDNILDELMLHTAREGRLYCGEGVCDIAGMVRAVPDVTLSIELPNAIEMEQRGAPRHARQALVTAKEYFLKHSVE